MRVGAAFPSYGIPADPIAIRDFAQAVEDMGFDHLVVFDHVLGANIANRDPWPGPYTYEHKFHEPMVLFGYLSALTTRIELVSAVLILPQRQAVLVAKQAAEVDILSGGRLRLGVGIGWNPVEYESLNMNFRDRGRRSEEQIEVMRRLWTNELVSFHGKEHTIEDAGLNPLPVQRPIPVWIGAAARPALERVARIADGWFPLFDADEKSAGRIQRMRGMVEAAGRDPNAFGVDGRIMLSEGTPDDWIRQTKIWRESGASHLTVRTFDREPNVTTDHIGMLRRYRESGALG